MKTAMVVAALTAILLSGGVLTPLDADDAYTYPPVIEMSVGDLFVYDAETNLDTVMTASGTGLVDDPSEIDGAFLYFEDDRLFGVASQVGTFTVDITAIWTCPEDSNLTQIAVQYITFHVTDADSPAEQVQLSYNNGWSLATTPIGSSADASSTEDADDQPNYFDKRNVIVICIVVSAMLFGIAIGRKN